MILNVFCVPGHRRIPNKFIFADEAGCFTFNRKPNVSKFFVVCTVVMDDCAVGAEPLNLRRRLAWEGAELGDYFHATTDKQAIRDEVYKVIPQYPFTIQATIMEKCKAQPQVRTTKDRFYQYAYFYHFKFGTTLQLNKQSECPSGDFLIPSNHFDSMDAFLILDSRGASSVDGQEPGEVQPRSLEISERPDR